MAKSNLEPIPIRVHGFDASSRHFSTTAAAHRHNEVELVYGRGGDVTLIFDGRPVYLAEGQSAMFWAVVPHFSRKCVGDAELCWVHVPLAQFLSWHIHPEITQAILRGQILRDPSPRSPHVFAEQLYKWNRFAASGDADARRIVDLEVEALFREASMNVLRENATLSIASPNREPGEVGEVEAMISYIARHYQEAISVDDVAASAGLKPGYAMRRFRYSLGMTIVGCINEHRIGHVQRMLLTTDVPVLEILLDAGFGSVTQFYTIFDRTCGCTPTEYRRRRGAVSAVRYM